MSIDLCECLQDYSNLFITLSNSEFKCKRFLAIKSNAQKKIKIVVNFNKIDLFKVKLEYIADLQLVNRNISLKEIQITSI